MPEPVAGAAETLSVDFPQKEARFEKFNCPELF